MRRAVGICIAFIIPVTVIGLAALTTNKPGPPEMAQATLNRYLAHLRQAGHPANVLTTRPASYPFRFTAPLSGPVFGDSSYYNVLSLESGWLPPVPTLNSLWAGPAITYSLGISPVLNSGYDNGHLLPYPPEEIWCVHFQLEDMTAPAVTVLLAHYPKGLYGDSWTMHELPPATAAQTLALVGCASN